MPDVIARSGSGQVAPGLTTYVRQAREHPAYRWWRLPLAGVFTVLFFFGGSILVLLVAWLAAPGPIGHFIDSGDAELNVRSNPVVLLMGLGSIAIILPAVFVAVLITGPRPVGHLSSVYGRLRWRWLIRTTAVALILIFGSILFIALVLDPTPVKLPSERLVVGIVIVLVATPVQAAAEEYLFRGYLMQLVGSWTRWVWLPVVVNVPLFAAAHGYSRWGTVDVAIFGLTASLLVIRTGGLEASIAFHIANNVSLGVLEAFGLVDTSDTGTGPLDIVPTAIMAAIYLIVVEVMFRRSGLHRARRRALNGGDAPIGWAGEPAAV
jgi:membrane protease YdiL (CAAX protease family)